MVILPQPLHTDKIIKHSNDLCCTILMPTQPQAKHLKVLGSKVVLRVQDQKLGIPTVMALSISRIIMPNYIIITPAREPAVIVLIRQACSPGVILGKLMVYRQMGKEFLINYSS